MREILERGLAAMGICPPEGSIDQLLLYSTRLIAQNQVMNLTAITAPDEIARLHFLDSAALLTLCDLRGKSLIDVGTGAGFPGVVLKILEPSIKLTLLDSLQKRLAWLATLCAELGLDEVEILHARAEDGAHTAALRDHFDHATARAVAALPMLCELCLPYVRPGGSFLAMKTAHDAGELDAAAQIVAKLGGGAISTQDYSLPETKLARRLISVEKRRATPAAYPRKWAKIKQAKI